jgi:hypothetical protein
MRRARWPAKLVERRQPQVKGNVAAVLGIAHELDLPRLAQRIQCAAIGRLRGGTKIIQAGGASFSRKRGVQRVMSAFVAALSTGECLSPVPIAAATGTRIQLSPALARPWPPTDSAKTGPRLRRTIYLDRSLPTEEAGSSG